MFVTLRKDYLGHKAGATLDIHEEANAKSLIDTGVAEEVPGDPYGPLMAKAVETSVAAINKNLDAVITESLKQFANAQTKSNKNKIPAIFGQGGEGDPQRTFGNFLLAVRRGDVKALEEMGSQFVENSGVQQKTALTSQTGGQGGYTVPVEFLAKLMSIASESSIVERYAMKIPMASQVVEIPVLDHTTAPTAGETAMFGGVQANWTEEAATMGEEEPIFKQARLAAHELSGFAYVSNTLLQDNAIGLESLLQTLFGGAIGWHKDYAFLRGNGAGKPLGVVNWAGLISVTRSAASAFALADAAGMLARLLKGMNEKSIVWVCHPTVLAKLYQMVSSSTGGQTVFIDNARDHPVLTLLGYPVLPTEKLPALNTLGDVVLCDFSKYVIGERQGVEIAFSEHYRFTNNQGTWRFVTRVDGRPWMNDKVTLSDASSTLSPFVGLAAG